MSFGQKNTNNVAIGVFMEGELLQLVSMTRRDGQLKILNAEILKMHYAPSSVAMANGVLDGLDDSFGDTINLDELEEEGGLLDSENLDGDSGAESNATIIINAIEQMPVAKNGLGISVPEPQIFYTYLDSDWGLTGKKLKQRVIEELSQDRRENQILTAEQVHLVKQSDGKLLAITIEQDFMLLNTLANIKLANGKRPPRIQFVEPAEFSLLNLVRRNYSFDEEQNSVIIYIGAESSRMIFLKGDDLSYISQQINHGSGPEEICRTVISRLILEQDNQKLNTINNIILAGEASEIGMEDYLVEQMPKEMRIEYLRLADTNVAPNDPILSRFAVAIGNAVRILDPEEKDPYSLDLMPKSIKEGQKIFKLGIIGWILLALIPIMTVYLSYQMTTQSSEITQLATQITYSKSELEDLRHVEEELKKEKARLANYDKTMVIIDSLTVSMEAWSNFITNTSRLAKTTGSIWVTEIGYSGKTQVLIRGYATKKERIPVFCYALNNAILKGVDVQEIRNRTVFNFEVVADLEKK